ncbi:2-hydroxy-3-keto-5-methylthiopentenyl-1-phosphatephosphatase, fragment [Candidatus Babela massiliensis]|uniref:2-hydroxy-3-keto-5-methylthiopentenyl-1-phosphate phosphatase n=1 Tax=Candidatus Babela massiliensis TaxID=673862 RepID=V6DJA6_9BACT|nr:2-hydroxy-3-keto-5-methylthiopentenyl-1-phosphatephosphatase, fragment [Candidatus Babela massiliensis]CDK30596.1 2-hydroxy-3-keto-5-methylthiopentenyl-1-phosphatephosphatase, fragment [Candidatus Babela massiliensis]
MNYKKMLLAMLLVPAVYAQATNCQENDQENKHIQNKQCDRNCENGCSSCK